MTLSKIGLWLTAASFRVMAVCFGVILPILVFFGGYSLYVLVVKPATIEKQHKIDLDYQYRAKLIELGELDKYRDTLTSK